jgi:hypothetical protein
VRRQHDAAATAEVNLIHVSKKGPLVLEPGLGGVPSKIFSYRRNAAPALSLPQSIDRIAILVQMHEQVVIEKRVDQLES